MPHSLTVIPIGPGDPSLLTLQAADVLRAGGGPLILRTARHPVADWLQRQEIPFTSFDALYDQLEDFDAVYEAMARQLLEKAGEGPVRYGVPDPLTDQSLRKVFDLLPKDSAPEITLLPGVGAAGFLLPAVLPACPDRDLRVVSASSLLSVDFDPAQSLLITEVDSPLLAGDLKIRLSALVSDETEIWLLAGNDSPVPAVRKIPLESLDRQKTYDHRTAVFLPGASYLHRDRFSVQDLVHIMERLRARNGCPWDRVQTHESLKPYLVEEAWEAINAIDDQDPDHLADELGDVLLQIVFHASIARDCGDFSLEDVATHICAKMIQRHPHVFSDRKDAFFGDISDQWEKIKRSETGSRTVADSMNDVSTALPSLKYATKILKKTDQLPGWPRDPKEVLSSLRESAARLQAGPAEEEELGRLLILACQLCRLSGLDAEILLHETADRFKAAFKAMERAVLADGLNPESLTFSQMREYWMQSSGTSSVFLNK